MPQIEIEIKTLLQTKENAEKFLNKLKLADPNLKLTAQNSQLNHYFMGGDINKLSVFIHQFLNEDEGQSFHHIVNNGVNISVRTRQAETKIILVIKATLDDTTSSNGTARIEFEKDFGQILNPDTQKNFTLDDLDQILLDADFSYQAKWSRARQVYEFHPKSPTDRVTICLDKNAGYGYLAEFELVIEDAQKVETAKEYLRLIMQDLEVVELNQARLERMFTHYNANWAEYYGTDKTFNIE